MYMCMYKQVYIVKRSSNRCMYIRVHLLGHIVNVSPSIEFNCTKSTLKKIYARVVRKRQAAVTPSSRHANILVKLLVIS